MEPFHQRASSNTRDSQPDDLPQVVVRLMGYLVGIIFVCSMAWAVGETWFPMELLGDSGGNDLAGLSGFLWAIGALAFCVVAVVVTEVYLSRRRRRTQ